jgi:anti-anti-sigma factor
MEIYRKKVNDIRVYRIFGKLNSQNAVDLEKQLMSDIDRGTRSMVLDCRSIDYISSDGFRVILKTVERLKQGGEGQLVLCGLKDYIEEVFEVAGFDRMLSIAASREDALNVFSKRKESTDV